MAMWCEILYFQYHPCGLRRLSLPTQGHCFSERKAEYVGALCSQRWKKVTTWQKWAYLEACTVFVCVWIPHLLIMRKTCESQTARNWFLLSSTFNLSNLFQRYIQTLISYLFARIFFFLLNQMLLMSCYMNNAAFVCGKTEEFCIRQFYDWWFLKHCLYWEASVSSAE